MTLQDRDTVNAYLVQARNACTTDGVVCHTMLTGWLQQVIRDLAEDIPGVAANLGRMLQP